jgi:phosphomevalonate kinase
VAAIDRRALVTIDRSSGDSWELSAPGLVSRPARFDIGSGGTVLWQGDDVKRATFGLVEQLLVGVQESGSIDLANLPAATLVLDTRAFFEETDDGQSKLGLGSSAALTVALASALEAWSGGNPFSKNEGRLQRLIDLHRAVQGGAGSGIDVAASLLGGVIRFRLADDRSVAEADPLTLPEQLQTVFVWTGRAASTGDFLGRLNSRQSENPQEVDPVLDNLGAVSSAGVAALADGDSESFLDMVDGFWETLDRLGVTIGMPILSDEHRSLRRLASGCGVRYKPSGAGGGDFGIGYTTDSGAAAKFAEVAAGEGFQSLDLQVESAGAGR